MERMKGNLILIEQMVKWGKRKKEKKTKQKKKEKKKRKEKVKNNENSKLEATLLVWNSPTQKDYLWGENNSPLIFLFFLFCY